MDCRTSKRQTGLLLRPMLDPAHPVLGPMLALLHDHMESRGVSDPVPLLRDDGPVGLGLAAPVLQEGTMHSAGLVTFSYEIAPLMPGSTTTCRCFAVALRAPRKCRPQILMPRIGARSLQYGQSNGPAPSMFRR